MQSAGKIEHETILHQQDEFTQSPLCLTNSNSFKLHLTESRQCMMVKQVGNNNSKCTFELFTNSKHNFNKLLQF